MGRKKILGKCIVCGSELSEPLFVIDNMPCGAQVMPDKDGIKSDKGVSLKLSMCRECGLVQFDCEPVDYYREAIRVVGLSETMKELRRADFRHLMEDYGLEGGKILECGSSNGDFLEVLSEFTADIYGIESGADNIRESKRKLCVNGRIPESHVMQLFPEKEDLEVPGAPFDCFLSFNFLEHQPDPMTMLRCMYNNLRDGGIGFISVPSLEYIINNGNYYELIRDHIANYDMESMKYLLSRCGFSILEERFAGIGDTLEFVVRKENESVQQKKADEKSLILKEKSISALKSNYEAMLHKMDGFTASLKKNNRKAALWGAGHQGFTIAATTALNGLVSYIIDSSPKKQGRFAPVSHIPIVHPDKYFEDPVDVIMIAAPGYIKEIEADIRKRYESKLPAVCDVLDITER